jgi:PII-like signaling protein
MSREPRPAIKLTVSVGGDERHAHHPLYRAVLKALLLQGISGATLTKGVMSYG